MFLLKDINFYNEQVSSTYYPFSLNKTLDALDLLSEFTSLNVFSEYFNCDEVIKLKNMAEYLNELDGFKFITGYTHYSTNRYVMVGKLRNINGEFPFIMSLPLGHTHLERDFKTLVYVVTTLHKSIKIFESEEDFSSFLMKLREVGELSNYLFTGLIDVYNTNTNSPTGYSYPIHASEEGFLFDLTKGLVKRVDYPFFCYKRLQILLWAEGKRTDLRTYEFNTLNISNVKDFIKNNPYNRG